MYLNKAIKRQKKSFKIFIALMSFIFVTLPLIIIFLELYNIFIIIYLILLEVFISFIMIVSYNSISLKYKCKNGILRLKTALFIKEKVIICDKVVLVHTEKKLEDIIIILIISYKGRTRKFNLINKTFLKKHPIIEQKYKKIKKMYPENQYYYTIIMNGGYIKLELLDIIYRNCVKADYSDSSIENIKIARSKKNSKKG